MKPARYAVIAVVSLLTSTAVAVPPDHIDKDFSCTRGPLRLIHGNTLKGYQALGKPVSEKRVRDNYGLSLVRHYPGLELVFQLSPDGKRGLLAGLTCTGREHPVSAAVRIGMKAGDLPPVLKPRYRRGMTRLVVCNDRGECGSFHFRAGRVSRIEYSCFTG